VVQRQPVRRHRRRRRAHARCLRRGFVLGQSLSDLAKVFAAVLQATMVCVLYIGDRQAAALCTHSRQ
jgi:hypothetical protein